MIFVSCLKEKRDYMSCRLAIENKNCIYYGCNKIPDEPFSDLGLEHSGFEIEQCLYCKYKQENRLSRTLIDQLSKSLPTTKKGLAELKMLLEVEENSLKTVQSSTSIVLLVSMLIFVGTISYTLVSNFYYVISFFCLTMFLITYLNCKTEKENKRKMKYITVYKMKVEEKLLNIG